MLVKILKPFPYAHDGKHTVQLEAGTVVDIDASVLPGLHAEGYIGEADDAEIEAAQEGPVVLPPPVEIPADWRKLEWFELSALAQRLGAGPKVSKKAAVAWIANEVAARADLG